MEKKDLLDGEKTLYSRVNNTYYWDINDEYSIR